MLIIITLTLNKSIFSFNFIFLYYNKNENFIHFGCWNENKCNLEEEEPKNGLSSVVKFLENKDPEIQFYVIAGINYPTEEDDSKIFGSNNFFKSGFDCLAKCNKNNQKPIYLLMGNHDLVHKKDIKYKDTTVNIPRCQILKEQLSYNEYFDLKSIQIFRKTRNIIIFKYYSV